MRTLEACYEINFSKVNFMERKIKITESKTLISGAFKTGKSYLIYDFLSTFKPKDYLYIDFSDLRNDTIEVSKNLERFIRMNEISVLVLENFDFSFELPPCENIIISTKTPINLKGYKNIIISALDFEEYLLHDNRHQNITQSFNSFLKFGNIPELINYEDHKKINRLQEIFELQCKNETQYEIFKILIENIDEKKSLFQLFNNLKLKIKLILFYFLLQPLFSGQYFVPFLFHLLKPFFYTWYTRPDDTAESIHILYHMKDHFY